MNAIAFKCPECEKNMMVNAIWMNDKFEFFLQAQCEPCQKEFDYSVEQLQESIFRELNKNLVKGPKRRQ